MTIDTTATPLGANPPTDQHPATAPGQGIVHSHRTAATATRRYAHADTPANDGCGAPSPSSTTRTCQFLRMAHRQSRVPRALPRRPAPPPVADTLGPTPPDHTERASTNNDNDGHER